MEGSYLLGFVLLALLLFWVVRGVFKADSGLTHEQAARLASQSSPLTSPTYTGRLACIKQHFNGDFALGRSFWLTSLLITLIGPTATLMMQHLLDLGLAARHISAFILLVTALGMVSWGWAVLGTWASANKHVRRGGKPFWASAARVLIVLGVIDLLGSLGGMVSPLAGHLQIALGKQPGSLSRIDVFPDGMTIRMSGGINDGTTEQLALALAKAPAAKTLVLDSEGGWVKQSEELARLIKMRGLHTHVQTICASACTIAFLAGNERAADPEARIGFHAVRMIGGGTHEMTQQENDATLAAYAKAKLPLEFVRRIAATPSDQMWFPSHLELLAAGVLTRMSRSPAQGSQ